MKGEDLFKKQLVSFDKNISDILLKMGDKAVSYFKGNFDKQSFDGTPWAPSKSKDGDSKILDKTGELKNSIEAMPVANNTVSIQSNVPYATYIHEGTDKMPARPFLGQSKELTEEIKKLVNEEIKNMMK